MMKKVSIIFLAVFLFNLQAGCSAKRMATNVIGKIAIKGMAVFESEEDIEFARESAPALIKTMEVLKEGNPKDTHSLTVLSMSYGQFAFGFLEEDLLRMKKADEGFIKAKRRAELFYRRGKDYGISALKRTRAMREAFNAPFSDFNTALKKMGRKHADALFWTAFSWAGWLNLNTDDPIAIADLPRIEAIAKRVVEIDDGFYFGSAHALLGVLAASRPKMLGGNPPLSNEEFQKAFKIAPMNLMAQVLYAQYYARQIQDESLFTKTLNEVLTADEVALPEQRLSNELAKRRARLLLNKKGEIF